MKVTARVDVSDTHDGRILYTVQLDDGREVDGGGLYLMTEITSLSPPMIKKEEKWIEEKQRRTIMNDVLVSRKWTRNDLAGCIEDCGGIPDDRTIDSLAKGLGST